MRDQNFGPIANEITAVATLSAAREATVTPKISAQITKMDLLKNRTVHAGDVIAILESRDLAAQHAAQGIRIDERTAVTRWAGERMDYDIAVDGLIRRLRRAQTFQLERRRFR